MSVANIVFRLPSVGIDCGSRAKSCGGRKGSLSQDQHLLQIFGRGPYWFGIFGSGSTSVEEIDAPDCNPGEDITCGYLGIQ